MKKIFAILAVLFVVNVNAQKEFQGMAIYEAKTSVGEMGNNFGGREITPEMRARFMERMKSVLEKTYVLNFDRNASVYKEQEKLEIGNSPMPARMISSMMGMGGSVYKNVKEKSFRVDKEFMGKEFLVVDSLPTLKWKMEQETKVIGGYTCFKATAVKPVSKSDLRNLRPKQKQQDKEEAKSTNLRDSFDLPDEVVVTAWYAPEIPVNQGPETYWGLPGLILEVNDGKTIILCSKVVLNVKEKAEIKAPTKGTQVTQKEFDDIVIKKRKEIEAMGGPRGMGNHRFGG